MLCKQQHGKPHTRIRHLHLSRLQHRCLRYIEDCYNLKGIFTLFQSTLFCYVTKRHLMRALQYHENIMFRRGSDLKEKWKPQIVILSRILSYSSHKDN